MFCDKEERLLYVLSVILRQMFQKKPSEFPGQHNKISDHDNNVLLFKIKIFEEMRILKTSFIDGHEFLKL